MKRLLPYLREGKPDPTDYLTLRAAADRTGFSYDYVYDAVRRGDLPASQKGRMWRVRATDLAAWMDRGRAGAAPPSRPELQSKVSRLMPGLAT